MAAYRVFPFVAPIRLYGDAEASAAAAAALAIEKAMQGVAGGVAGATGDLTPVGKPLEADAVGGATAEGELDSETALRASALAGGQAAGGLGVGKQLGGAAQGRGVTAAELAVLTSVGVQRAPSPWPGRTVAAGLSVYALQPSIDARTVW